MLALVRNANLALAFMLELAMLAAFAVGALSVDLNPLLRWMAAIIIVGVAIAAWAIWAAPMSSRRLSGLALALFELTLFVLAALVLLLAGQAGWAVTFAALAALNLSLAWAWDQQ
jgi:hypothetical protein